MDMDRRMVPNGFYERVTLMSCTDESGRLRTVQETYLEDVILDYVHETLGTSTRFVASRLHVHQPTVWRVLLLDCW
ncbi:hypothetical protein TNCV_2690541 [Trichonephila clavipes]|uniref:Uncharacterized protein n=1 Tax=Trichonephila clavipes TaxID=2585209 RepID=A0A8X6VYE9_TRICX|nr:hypothetical protein TNCV_2690541 [Trichonephila clavipes]